MSGYFRGISTKTKKFIEGDLIHDNMDQDDDSLWIRYWSDRVGFYLTDRIYKASLGEKIGLQNTSRQNFYTGSIFRASCGTIGWIKKVNHQYIPLYWENGKIKELSWIYVKAGEIIGNTYENPSIITNTKKLNKHLLISSNSKFVVIKIEDIKKYLSKDQEYDLEHILCRINERREDDGKDINKYIVINEDEPSIDEIKSILNKNNIHVE